MFDGIMPAEGSNEGADDVDRGEGGERTLCKEIFRTVATTPDDKEAEAQISAMIDDAVASKTSDRRR